MSDEWAIWLTPYPKELVSELLKRHSERSEKETPTLLT